MNSPTSLPRLPSAPRILIRGTNWLGDAVMTTPALLRLREKFPDAHLVLLAPEKLRDLGVRHPAVDETMMSGPGQSVFSVGKQLRAGRFDLALVLPNSPRSVIETWLAGIPQRVGQARPWRNWFLTTRVTPRPDAVRMHKRSVDEIQRLVTADASRRAAPNGRVPMNAAAPVHQIHEYLHLAAALGANPEPLPPAL